MRTDEKVILAVLLATDITIGILALVMMIKGTT